MLAKTARVLGRGTAVCVRHARLHASGHVRAGAVKIYAPTEQGLELVAAHFAKALHPGDCYCLYGDVGAGKSVWSRAFIRAAAQDPGLPVPSPTYLLQNIYDDHGQPEIHHFDLYRLTGGKDLMRLDLQQSFSSAVCLIEWAERLNQQEPPERMAVHIEVLMEDQADVRISDQTATPDLSSSLVNGSDEGEEDIYTDKRCRRLTLVAHGSSWQQRLESLTAALSDVALTTEDGAFVFR